MPVIPATQGAEALSRKKPNSSQKKGLEEWFRVSALSSSPSTAKNEHKTRESL
jgi:hypothetical protein